MILGTLVCPKGVATLTNDGWRADDRAWEFDLNDDFELEGRPFPLGWWELIQAQQTYGGKVSWPHDAPAAQLTDPDQKN